MGNRNAGTQGESMGCEGRGKRIAIVTFGCQMNARDSEIILGMLQKKGYKCARRLEEADVILFNTCSVRQHAEERVWGKVRMLKRLVVPPKFAGANLSRGDIGSPRFAQRANLNGETPRPTKKIVGLVGCMAQNYQDEIFRRFSHIDLVCGPANIYDIPNLLEKVVKEKVQVLAVNRATRPLQISSPQIYSSKSNRGDKPKSKRRGKPLYPDCGFRINNLKAYVSIMYGCNNFCSYCIVPYVRGRERSRPLRHILDQVKDLAQRRCKEITLLGQNVNSYGKDLKGRIDFVRLLERLDKIEGIERIRFVTSHPKDAFLKLFRAMRNLPKVCEHLHLPLQAGSDRMLRLMNRGYTLADYLRLIDNLRRLIPNCSLTTDIIVGFPGESEADFKKTIYAMQKIQFDQAFIFKYSPRSKTKAAQFRDGVPLQEKQRRNQILLRLQEQISLEKNRQLLGKSVQVLAEGMGKSLTEGIEGEIKKGVNKGIKRVAQRDILQGRSRTNKVTLFSGTRSLISQIVNVRINKVTTHALIGGLNGKPR